MPRKTAANQIHRSRRRHDPAVRAFGVYAEKTSHRYSRRVFYLRRRLRRYLRFLRRAMRRRGAYLGQRDDRKIKQKVFLFPRAVKARTPERRDKVAEIM